MQRRQLSDQDPVSSKDRDTTALHVHCFATIDSSQRGPGILESFRRSSCTRADTAPFLIRPQAPMVAQPCKAHYVLAPIAASCCCAIALFDVWKHRFAIGDGVLVRTFAKLSPYMVSRRCIPLEGQGSRSIHAASLLLHCLSYALHPRGWSLVGLSECAEPKKRLLSRNHMEHI